MRHRFLSILAATLGFTSSAYSIGFQVRGINNPYLAGDPDGTTASGYDIAPAQSPYLVSLDFASIQSIQFLNVTGQVGYGPNNPTGGPEGIDGFTTYHGMGAQNGKSSVTAQVTALMGVFLTENRATGTAPSALDFSTQEQMDYLTLSPLLAQVFFIGDGLTSSGTPQTVIVPSGARRLFLGVMDGGGWYNNFGTHQGDISTTTAVPEPATIAILGLSSLGFAMIRRGRRENSFVGARDCQ